MTDLFDMHSLNHAALPNLHCATHVQAFSVPNGYMNVERRTPMGADGLRHRAFEAWTRCPCSRRKTRLSCPVVQRLLRAQSLQPFVKDRRI